MEYSIEELSNLVLEKIDVKELSKKIEEYKKEFIPKFIDEVEDLANNLALHSDFEKYVNSREYELNITNKAKTCRVDDQVYKSLLEKIKYHLNKENKKVAFSIYFVLYTMCRRQNYGDFLVLALEYLDDFA